MTEASVERSRLETLSGDLKDTIAPELEKATKDLEASKGGSIGMDGGDFSITGTMAAMAYPMALQYAYQDLTSQQKVIEGYAKGVETTAKNWKNSEDASTVKKV